MTNLILFTVGLGTCSPIERIDNEAYSFKVGTPTAVKYEITVLEDSRLVYHYKSEKNGNAIFEQGNRIFLIKGSK